MKKIFYFLILILFISCNEDDDPLNSIIGIWHLDKFAYVCANGRIIEEPYTECQKRTYYKFNSDGTGSYRSYLDRDPFGDCIIRTERSFTWQIENNIIDLNIEDFTTTVPIVYKKISNTIIREIATIEVSNICNGNPSTAISYDFKRAN